MRRIVKYIGIVLAALLLLVLAVFGFLQTETGRGIILAQVQAAMAAGPIKLQAGGISGVVPFDMAVEGVVLSDEKGIWLTIDRVALDWSPLKLLSGTVEVSDLHLGNVDMVRVPETTADASTRDDGAAAPSWPSLPVDIMVQSFTIERLSLGAPILGEAAVFTAQASASLGDIDDGLAAKLTLRRMDGGDDRIDADIAYRPADDTLKLALAVHEPRGGLLTRLAGLPGAPNLQIDATGDGPLTSWQGGVTATLDAQKLLTLALTTEGPASQRAIGFTLDADPRRLLADDVKVLLMDGIKARGKVTVDQPAGLLHVHDFQAAAASAILSAQGSVGLDAPGKLGFTLRTGSSAPYAVLLPEVSWGAVDLQGEIKGEIAAPQVAATGTLTDLVAGGQRVGFTDISITADPAGTFAEGIDIDALINATDITLTDPTWQPLLADGARLGVQGRIDLTGKADIRNIDLNAGPLALFGSAQAEGWGTTSLHSEIDAKATRPPSLDDPLGQLQSVSILADKDAEGARIDLSGEGEALSLGIAAVDGLLGDSPTVALRATQDTAGDIDLTEATLKGRTVALNASGTVKGAVIDMALEAALSDLSALDPAAKGAVALQAKISGTQAAPQIAAVLTSKQITYDQRSATAVALNIDGQDLVNAPQLVVNGTAMVDGLKASINTRAIQQPQNGTIAIRDMRLGFGRSSVSGQADVTGTLVAGNLTLDMPALAELQRLTGLDLAGAITADIVLSHDGGKQNVGVNATMRDLAYAQTATIGDGTIAAQIGDVAGMPSIDGRVDLRDVAASGQKLDTVALTARSIADGMAITAQASGTEIALDLAADLANLPERQAITLTALTASYRAEQVTLAGPATLTREGETMRVTGLDLRARDGRITLDAATSPAGNEVDLKIAQFPLALLKVADPGVDAVGTVDATLALSGPRSNPTAQFSVAGKEMGLRGQRGLSAGFDLTGEWRGGRVTTDGRFSFSTGGGLDLSAALGLPADPATGFPAFNPNATLQANAKGTLDLSILDIVLAGGADRVSGKADVDLLADGTLGAPGLSGSIKVSDGRYDNVRYGIKLRKLMAELRGNGQRIDLVSLSANTPGGGRISGQGQVGLGEAMPVEIALNLDKAQVLNMPDAFAVADARLQAGGDLTEQVTLAGNITLRKAEIRIPDNLPPSIQEIETVEINVPPVRAAKIEAAAKPPSKSLGIALDIAVDVPQQMSIRGRGLDAELGGALKITGTADQPLINGAIKMRRGTLDLVGRQLSFSRGQVIFDGAPKIDPVLDFTANARAEGYDVAVNVGGHVSLVRISLSSTPPLPEDEILSRLLFGKASGSLSALEAIQLAQATAELAGVGGGTDLLDKIRKETGLDRLSVDAGDGTAGPSLGAGRYVSEGVYVGVKQGTAGSSSAATVEVEVTPNVKVEGEVGANSTGKAGIYWEWDY